MNTPTESFYMMRVMAPLGLKIRFSVLISMGYHNGTWLRLVPMPRSCESGVTPFSFSSANVNAIHFFAPDSNMALTYHLLLEDKRYWATVCELGWQLLSNSNQF
jgi:hypothetical protein